MPVLCPHCHNPVDSVTAAADDILCAACGASFRCESEATTVWNPADHQRTLGKFELIDLVGVGAFGSVYRARDKELGRIVAVKVPRVGSLGSIGDSERFFREARSVAQLRHASIVSVFEIGQIEGVPYLVSEFVNGLTLADLLTSERMPPRAAAELVAQIADALHYAHGQGVIHRDVKPSNIMLEKGAKQPLAADTLPQPFVPRLMDFGLAKRSADEVSVTIEGQVLGTPAYMSPEQARGEAHTVDGRGDVYSLGVILYQLLTGELPFKGNVRMLLHHVLHDEPKPPRQREPQVPRDLETVCLKAMTKEPARRYQTASELAADLRRFLADQPIHARPVRLPEKAWLWCRRNPGMAGLSAVALALLVAVAVLLAMRIEPEPGNLPDASLLRVQRAGKLVIATDPSYPPMEFRQDGNMVGFDIDLARALAGRLGVQAEFVALEWDWQNLVKRINIHEFDILISAVTVTEDRLQQVSFVEYERMPLVFVSKQGVVVANEQDLAGKIVAVQTDTTTHQLLLGLKRKGIAIGQVIVFPGAADPFEAIRKGRADVTLAHQPVAHYYVRQDPTLTVTGLVAQTMTPDQVGIAFCKQDKELQRSVTESLRAMRQDGTLARLRKPWLDR